jgi:hypothetical protein
MTFSLTRSPMTFSMTAQPMTAQPMTAKPMTLSMTFSLTAQPNDLFPAAQPFSRVFTPFFVLLTLVTACFLNSEIYRSSCFLYRSSWFYIPFTKYSDISIYLFFYELT